MSVSKFVFLFLAAHFTTSLVFGNLYSLNNYPHTVYDIANSKYRYSIKCDEVKSGDLLTNEIAWYEWHSNTSDVKYSSFHVTTCGSNSLSNTSDNKWLYVIYDTNKNAEIRLMTINDVVGICHECGNNTNGTCKNLSFSLDNKQGRYWFGVDEDYKLTLTCIKSDTSTISNSNLELIIFISFFALLFCSCILIICYIYSTAFKEKKKTQTEDDRKSFVSDPEEEKIDEVLTLINDVLIESANDSSCLDVYQLLAFHRMEISSHEFSYIHKDYQKWLFISKYQILLIICAVVGALQSFGITVTIYGVASVYFHIDNSISNDAQCEWQLSHWKTTWHNKILAFLWSLVISTALGVYISNLRKTGLYRLLRDTGMKHYKIFSTIIDYGILEMGMIINLYALFIAAFGSFFLIYSSEGGSDALDMTLNAVALFFLLEVDDVLVSTKEANVLKEKFEKFKKDYQPIKQKNNENDLNCCSESFVRKWVLFGRGFARLVRIFIAICVLIAPWAIMICW